MMNRIALAMVLGGLSLWGQAPPDRPEKLVFPPQTFTMPQAGAFRARLKNGVTAYIAAQPQGVPFVRMTVHIKGGSFLDPKGKEGLALITGEDLRMGGTEATPADTLDERLEFLAGSIRSAIADTSGSVSMEFMEKDLKEGLDLFMQVLTRPAFDQARLNRTKAGLLQRLQSRNDKVNDIARYELAPLLNGENHFTSAQMTESSVKAITREDLVAFHRQLLHPENLVVSVSGKFQRKAMLELLNASLGSLKAGPGARVSPKPPAPEFQRKPGLYVVDKNVPQSLVRFTLPGLRRTDPDWHAAVVMNHILGSGGFTSRLMKKIRSDEGLTYGISTGFSEGPFWKGNWTGAFQTKNRSVAFALKLTLAEIERIRTAPVAEEELAVVKDSIIQAFPGQWSNQALLAEGFAQENLNGWREDWFLDYREKIAAVTAADVLRVARKYLDTRQMVILVVGNASEAEAGDAKDHPGLLKDLGPLTRLPLRDPLSFKALS